MLGFHLNFREFFGVSILLCVLAVSSCASTLRYPARSIPSTYSTDERLLESMNYHLLTNVWSTHLTIELDWVEGVAPDPRAIEHLKLTLKDLVPRNKTVDVLLDDEIPLKEWSELPRSNLRLLAQKYVDHLPSIQDKRHTIYILYAPRSNNNREEESYYGLFTQWWISRDQEYLPIDGIAIFLEPIREHTHLPVRNVEGEKATLAHELGHSAGLCSNWIHEAKGHPGHCRNVECVLTQPGSRAATYNFLPSLFTGNLPQKFCSDCRADLARFKQQVRELARRHPVALENLKQQRKAEQKIEALMQQRAYEDNYKDDKQVLALIDQSVQKFPKSAKLAHRATLEALRLGEPEVALNYALQGLQADPFHAVGLKAAALLARKGEHDRALDILDENYLAAYEQVGLDAYLERARILSKLGRPREGMWLLKDARKAYRDDPNAVAQLTIGIAKLLRLQERPKRALYQLKKTPRFMNQDGRILFERIKSYEQLNKPKRISKALASYVKYSNSAYEQIGSHPDISTLILAEARLGEVEAVKQRLDELKPFEAEIPYLAILRVQATTQLGQLEHAWNLVKDPSFDKARERYWSYDPCDDEEIAPLTSDPRFAKRFPECRYN